MEKKLVYYEDFGAVGDGKNDDFFAVKRAHDFANENGLEVKGTPGKTYRIYDIVGDSEAASYISIKTNTDWTDTSFIIDDRGFGHKDKNNSLTFKVESDYPVLSITEKEDIEKIFPGRKIEAGFNGKIGWSDYGYDALLIVKNANHRNYIRAGAHQDSGQIQSELIVVDKDGQIREGTEFLYAYDDITLINVYRIDERPVTITGGTFTHIANDIPMVKENWGYYSRGIRVFRSGTVVDGLTHIIEGELPGSKTNDKPKGAPYSGFLSAVCSTDVTFKNCILPTRRYSGLAGTYGFQAGSVNNMYLYNVKQSNYYCEDGVTPTLDYNNYWGICISNGCKNLIYDSCLMSRYDAHCGVYRGKIINSTVCNLELIGGGDMLIENTTFTPISFTPIMLRGDYGHTWNGTLTVKDCTVKNPQKPITTFLSVGWRNQDFGYTTCMPNLIIDNLKWDIPEREIMLTNYDNPELVCSDILSDGSENINKRTPAEYIRVINNKDGVTYKMHGTPLVADTEIEGVEII